MTTKFKEPRLTNRMKVIFLCLWWALLLWAYESNAQGLRRFRVSHLDGDVWTRSPNQPRWIHAWDGQLLTEGQIIQVTKGARVTLNETNASDLEGTAGERLKISLTQPIIARITADMLRSVTVSSYFVEDKKSLFSEAAPTQDYKFDLQDAWQRLTAVVTGRTPQVTSATLAQLAREGMALGTSANRLSILAPSTNSVIESREWPVEMKIAWRHPDKRKLKYSVYLWASGLPRGAPVAVTESDFYTVQVVKPGVYLAQVTSVDSAWQSPAQVVHGILPADIATPSEDIPIQRISVKNIWGSYPKDHTTILSRAEKINVVFAWESDFDQTANIFEFKIYDDHGQIIDTKKSMTNQVNVSLGYGRYHWFVTSAGGSLQTEKRVLIVNREQQESGIPSYRGEISRMVKQTENATLVLSEGL